MMIEHFRKCIGKEARFAFGGSDVGSYFVGQLIEFDSVFAYVRGHNGKCVLIGMNTITTIESEALQEDETKGTLPRPA